MTGAFDGAEDSLYSKGGEAEESSATRKHGSRTGSRPNNTTSGRSDHDSPTIPDAHTEGADDGSAPADSGGTVSDDYSRKTGDAGTLPGGLAALLSENGEALAAFNASGICTYINSNAARLCQRPAWELTGMPLDTVILPLPAFLGRQAHRVLQENLPVRMETYIPSADTWFEFRCWPQDGGGILLHGRDISDRKRLEEQIRHSEERWQFALRGDGDAVWDFDLREGGAFFSERWRRQFLSPGETIDPLFDAWAARLHPEDAPHVTAALYEHIEGVTPLYLCEYRIRTGFSEDGAPNYRWALDRGVVLRDERGDPYRLSGATTDITERRALEGQLTKTVARFERIARATGDGIFEWDLDADTIYLSERCREILCLTAQIPAPQTGNEVFKSLVNALHDEDRARFRTVMERLASGEAERQQVDVRLASSPFTPNDHEIRFDLASESDPGGHIRLIFGAVTDISACETENKAI